MAANKPNPFKSNPAEFDRTASALLEQLFDQIDDALGDWLEIDLTGGILNIELPDGGTYIINKHTPNCEIWVSSPKSGAWHFAPDDEGAWHSTRSQASGNPELLDLLSHELSSASGRAIKLQA